MTRSRGNSARVVDAFVGEYASGKTEVSINRALDLSREFGTVTLLDLDTEEPVYTVRSVKPVLEERGLRSSRWTQTECLAWAKPE